MKVSESKDREVGLTVPSGLSKESLVFLDYDGVLTSNVSGTSAEALMDSKGGCGRYHFDVDCFRRLLELCLDCGCRVVISSNWRRFDYLGGEWNGFKNPLPRLLSVLDGLVLGCLPKDRGLSKSEALRVFFEENPKYRGKYVVFDDDPSEEYQHSEFNGHFILTDREVGLTDEDVKKAKGVLGHGKR